jgi:hypothetical protein
MGGCAGRSLFMGTIKPEFWNFKFIIAPNEFESFLTECDKYNRVFILPAYGNPQHNKDQIMESFNK